MALEIEFHKDCIIIRKYVDMPLGGKQKVEQRINYEQLENAEFTMHVFGLSIVKKNNDYKLIFKVKDFNVLKPPKQLKEIRIKLNESCFKYNLIYIGKYRKYFPGYRIPFTLEIDGEFIETYVTSAPAGTKIGDPNAGQYIQKGLRKFFDKYKGKLKPGDEIIIKIEEPMKHYKLIVPTK